MIIVMKPGAPQSSVKEVIEKLFDDYAPKYEDRNGGYTRVIKTSVRRGDNAQLAIVELV